MDGRASNHKQSRCTQILGYIIIRLNRLWTLPLLLLARQTGTALGVTNRAGGESGVSTTNRRLNFDYNQGAGANSMPLPRVLVASYSLARQGRYINVKGNRAPQRPHNS